MRVRGNKGSSLVQRAKDTKGIENKLQLSHEARVSYNTIQKYIGGEGMKALDLRVLCTVLIDGVGFTPEELLNARFGDIFDYVEDFEEFGAAG